MGLLSGVSSIAKVGTTVASMVAKAGSFGLSAAKKVFGTTIGRICAAGSAIFLLSRNNGNIGETVKNVSSDFFSAIKTTIGGITGKGLEAANNMTNSLASVGDQVSEEVFDKSLTEMANEVNNAEPDMTTTAVASSGTEVEETEEAEPSYT